LLERLTGFKCDINDGLSSKVCRSCYEKIMKFKKFSDIFLQSAKQQQSLIRFIGDIFDVVNPFPSNGLPIDE